MSDVPRLLSSNSIERTDKVSICDCVRWLFQLPQIFSMTRDRSRRVEYDFRTVQTQCSCAFRKMSVITNIDAHICISGLKNRIAKIAWLEIKLFPETRM